LSIQNIKDLIPILELTTIWNQVFNILNGQFLAKRNSNEKWREGFTCRVFYGISARGNSTFLGMRNSYVEIY
jgi:hypothetical protein